jgi:hypothetical protein
MHLAVVGGQGDRIRALGGASLAVSDGERHRVHRLTIVVAMVALLAQFALILMVSVAIAIALLPLLTPAPRFLWSTSCPAAPCPVGDADSRS